MSNASLRILFGSFQHRRYAPKKGKTAGTKAPPYKTFLQALPDALRKLHATTEGVPIEDVQPVEYVYKNEKRTDSSQAPKGVIGWEMTEFVPIERENTDSGPDFDEPTSADQERCEPFELMECGMEPDYETLFAVLRHC